MYFIFFFFVINFKSNKFLLLFFAVEYISNIKGENLLGMQFFLFILIRLDVFEDTS